MARLQTIAEDPEAAQCQSIEPANYKSQQLVMFADRGMSNKHTSGRSKRWRQQAPAPDSVSFARSAVRSSWAMYVTGGLEFVIVFLQADTVTCSDPWYGDMQTSMLFRHMNQ